MKELKRWVSTRRSAGRGAGGPDEDWSKPRVMPERANWSGARGQMSIWPSVVRR